MKRMYKLKPNNQIGDSYIFERSILFYDALFL